MTPTAENLANERARRVVLDAPPFAGFGAHGSDATPWIEVPQWPARWVRLDPLPAAPFVAGYRLDFTLAAPRRFRAHVTGDERYELVLDGWRVARGPARAPLGWWHYESFDFELPAGTHTLAARVWSLGPLAPWAQTSFVHGFLFAPESEDLWEVLATGRARWLAKGLPGYGFGPPIASNGGDMGGGASFDLNGAALDWDWLAPGAAGWLDPVTSAPGNAGRTLYVETRVPWLRPSELPAPLDASVFPPTVRILAGDVGAPAWQQLGTGETLTVAPHQKVRAVFDWHGYVAAYPALTVDGGAGAAIRLGWAEASAGGLGGEEALAHFVQPTAGFFDTFHLDGGVGRTYEPLWWRCGRFVILEINTAAESLTLTALSFRETRHPYTVRAAWRTGDPGLERVLASCRRTLELCAHETFMDCPFWEQLQYAGDTRVQALCAYALTGDDVLARRALRAFAASRLNRSGWPASSHPSPSLQSIPTFALAWSGMLYDFALWRGDRGFVREIMPAARAALEAWLSHRRADGLVECPPGWNFLDWMGSLGQMRGIHGAVQWLVVGALRQAEELERWLGEKEFAARAGRLARETAASAEAFWCEARGLYADDPARLVFSEHANALALLSGLLTPERAAVVAKALFEEHAPEPPTRTGIYFSHFLFEAAARYRHMDVFWRRLAPWRKLVECGAVTTPENFGPTRSECHAWGAHPLYHLLVSVAGVRPGSFGFETVRFDPQPGPLHAAALTMPHSRGPIHVTWCEGQAPGLTLPPGLALAQGN